MTINQAPSTKLYRSQTPYGTWFTANLPRRWSRARVVDWLTRAADVIDNGGTLPLVKP